MEIIKRSEAKKLGLTTYFTGKPCLKGHISERYVSSFNCTKCIKDNKSKYIKRNTIKCINTDSWEGVRFSEANKNKLIFYEGKKCNRCTNTKRYTNNSECVYCSSVRIKSDARKKYIKAYNSIPGNREKEKVRRKKYLARNSKERLKSIKLSYSNNPASYTTYNNLLTVEEAPILLGIDTLAVRCSYCGEYFIPKHMHVNKRVQCLKGNYKGESRLYCSEDCKSSCTIFNKQGKLTTTENSRPLQSDWKKLYIEYRRSLVPKGIIYCEKCGVSEDVGLIAHHRDPVINNPIESADIDNCMLLCKSCHDEVHSKIGCSVYELRCK